MSTSETKTVRDQTKPADYYRAFIARELEAMQAYTSYNNPALFRSVAPKCVRIGLALYSAGADVSECFEWFGKAADYQTRFIAEGTKFSPEGRGSIDDYLEIYSAAFLAGRSKELLAALQRCTYTEPGHPVIVRLLDQFITLLRGGRVEASTAEAADAAAAKKEWGSLPALFDAASDHDIEAAGPALDAYLVKSWSPMIEREAKRALKSPTPDYWGKWSLLSAAVCRIVGGVANVSKKASSYIPSELAAA